MNVTQISVFVENKTGRLSAVTGALAGAGIDIRAVSISDTTEFGILRMIVNEPDRACEVLRANNFTISVTEVIAAEIDDRPGALNSAIGQLCGANIRVEYIYACLNPLDGKAAVLFKVDDNRLAVKVLTENGVTLLDDSRIRSL